MLWIILVSYIGIGALMIGMAQPLIERKVKPNDFYGVRTPKTIANEDIWYKANEYGGRVIRVFGAAIMVASVALLPLAHWGIQVYALTCTAVLFFGALWMTAVNLKYVAKL